MRIANRLIAFVVAAALTAAALILIIEVIAARADAAPVALHWHTILNWARRNTWKATSVEVASAITLAVGLLLLIPQLLPRRLTRLPLDTAEATDAALTRRGVAVTLRGAVADVEGISGVRVKVGRRRIRVNAYVPAPAENAEPLLPAVESAATGQLSALRLRTHHRLRVFVKAGSAGGRS